jgi:hypothetical protein
VKPNGCTVRAAAIALERLRAYPPMFSLPGTTPFVTGLMVTVGMVPDVNCGSVMPKSPE